MIAVISLIFATVYLIINRASLDPYQMGTLILLTELICAVESNTYLKRNN